MLTERNDYLEGQNSDHLKLLDLFQSKNANHASITSSEEPRDSKSSKGSKSSKSSPSNDTKLKEILSNYENDLFEATSLNKKLEFRNYMLEKRLADETELHRKQMAK